MVLGGRETASILRRGIFVVNKTKEFTSAELLNHLKRIIVAGEYFKLGLILFPMCGSIAIKVFI